MLVDIGRNDLSNRSYFAEYEAKKRFGYVFLKQEKDRLVQLTNIIACREILQEHFKVYKFANKSLCNNYVHDSDFILACRDESLVKFGVVFNNTRLPDFLSNFSVVNQLEDWLGVPQSIINHCGSINDDYTLLQIDLSPYWESNTFYYNVITLILRDLIRITPESLNLKNLFFASNRKGYNTIFSNGFTNFKTANSLLDIKFLLANPEIFADDPYTGIDDEGYLKLVDKYLELNNHLVDFSSKRFIWKDTPINVSTISTHFSTYNISSIVYNIGINNFCNSLKSTSKISHMKSYVKNYNKLYNPDLAKLVNKDFGLYCNLLESKKAINLTKKSILSKKEAA